MSRDLENDYYITHGGVVPVKWTAPEVCMYIHVCVVYECMCKLQYTNLQAIDFGYSINAISNLDMQS